MPEQNDKELHDWVRHTLHTYEPEYNPHEWKYMQRKLLYQQWWQKGIISLTLLLVTGFTLWWYFSDASEHPHTSKSPTQAEAVPENLSKVLKNQHAPFVTPADTNQQVALNHTETGISDRKQFDNFSPLSKKSIPFLPTNKYKSPVNNLITQAHIWLAENATPNYSFEEFDIKKQMLSGQFGADSTTYRVMSRNLHKWPDAVVVSDFTTSMYPYSTQLFAWFRGNTRKKGVKAMVFFTDCDSLGRETQFPEIPGQMFVSTQLEMENVLPVMIRAARNTVQNHQSEENDIEALLYAQTAYPQARHLILLADNSSPVKDMHLLDKMTKPVHVILCGAASDSTQAMQPEYLEVARRTKGTLHTIEDDLAPEKINTSTWLKVGQRYYRYSKRSQNFELKNFKHRPRKYLGLFWL
jgi:hypothetical protein